MQRDAKAPAGWESDGEREALGETKEPASTKIASTTQATLTGWLAELLAEVSAAPDRRVAANLLALSADAVATLPEPRRELLLERLQDTIRELPPFRA